MQDKTAPQVLFTGQEKTLQDLSSLEQERLYKLLLQKSLQEGHIDLSNALVPASIQRDSQIQVSPTPVPFEQAFPQEESLFTPTVKEHDTFAPKGSFWEQLRRWWSQSQKRPILLGVSGFCILLLLAFAILFQSHILPGITTKTPRLGSAKNAISTKSSRSGYSFLTCRKDKSDGEKRSYTLPIHITEDNGKKKVCTGTLLAPYALLTTRACRGSLGKHREERFVLWKGKKLAIQNDFTNPFSVSLNYYGTLNLPFPRGKRGRDRTSRPFAPRWLLKTTGVHRHRASQVPKMHGLHLFFVPELTPEFIEKQGLRIVHLDAFALLRLQQLKTPHKVSDSVTIPLGTGQKAPILRQLSKEHQAKGFLSLANRSKKTSSSNNPGHGSPVLGQLWDIRTKQFCETNLLMGLLQKDKKLIPTAYHPNARVDNAPITVDATRRNHLWLLAQMQDLDNDGITKLCDPNPLQANQADQSQCPPIVGKPQGSVTQGFPKGLLLCKSGDYVAGFRGRYSYYGLIHMALLCRPKRCLQGQKKCPTEYWTDAYGADPRPSASRVQYKTRVARCRSKQALSKIHFEIASDEIFYAKAFCSDFGTAKHLRSLPPIGRLTGKLHIRTCPKGEHIIGIVAHNRTFRRISSMQLICSKNTQ